MFDSDTTVVCGTCDWFRTDPAGQGVCVLESPVFHVSEDTIGCCEWDRACDTPRRLQAIGHLREAVRLAQAAHVEGDLDSWLTQIRRELGVRHGKTT